RDRRAAETPSACAEVSGSSRRLQFGRELAEEIVGEFLRGGSNEARSHGGNQSADLHVRLARDAGRAALRLPPHPGGAAHETRTALSLERERQRFRRPLVADRRLARVGALQSRDADLQRRFIGVGRRFLERLTPGNAFLQDRGIDQRREDSVAWRWY